VTSKKCKQVCCGSCCANVEDESEGEGAGAGGFDEPSFSTKRRERVPLLGLGVLSSASSKLDKS
jgi:hypothetical protein